MLIDSEYVAASVGARSGGCSSISRRNGRRSPRRGGAVPSLATPPRRRRMTSSTKFLSLGRLTDALLSVSGASRWSPAWWPASPHRPQAVAMAPVSQ